MINALIAVEWRAENAIFIQFNHSRGVLKIYRII